MFSINLSVKKLIIHNYRVITYSVFHVIIITTNVNNIISSFGINERTHEVSSYDKIYFVIFLMLPLQI